MPSVGASGSSRTFEGLIFLFACSLHFDRRCIGGSVEIGQNRRWTKGTEHVSKKIRPSKRLELYLCLCTCACAHGCVCNVYVYVCVSLFCPLFVGLFDILQFAECRHGLRNAQCIILLVFNNAVCGGFRKLKTKMFRGRGAYT